MLAVALLLLQPAPQDPQTVRDLTATLYGDDQEIVAEVFVKKASLSERDPATLSGKLEDGRMTYYTHPRSTEEQSQKVSIQFGAGTVDGKKKTFDLRENVEVLMADGSRISTADLFVNYPLQQLTTASPVKLARPNASLSGTGLEADDTLRQVTVLKDGTLEMTGRPADLVPRPGRPPRAPAPMATRLKCRGPLTIRDLAADAAATRSFLMIVARDGVRVEREEEGRTMTATADAAVIYVSRAKAPSGRESIEPVSMSLRGSIAIDDSSGARAKAAAAEWNSGDDLLRLEGAPHVEALQAGQRVRAKYAVIDRWSGRALFRGDLAATIAPGDDPSQTMDITAAELEIEAQPLGGRVQATGVRATGDVRMRGTMGKSPIDATGADFRWNAVENRGALVGAPYARIEQGESRMEAPEIVFEGRSMFVVKGPKRLHFVHLKPPGGLEKAWGAAVDRPAGPRTEITLLSAGDVSYDGAAGLITVLSRCDVRTEGVRLSADRLALRLAEGGDGIAEVRGSGDVRAEYSGTTVRGALLSYAPDRRAIEVRGEPHAVASFEGFETRNAVIRMDQETGRIELEGGRHRGRIDIPK